MIKVAVVYFSHTDVTGTLVRALGEGVSARDGVTVELYRIDGRAIVEGRYVNEPLLAQLSGCQAIVFASPTYMGGVSAQFKAFADATSELWSRQEWAGKLAAGVTCGSALNGDQSGTLQYFVTLASQHGMLWLGLDSASGYRDHGVNRLGCQLGVVAQSVEGAAHEADVATALYLGQRVAEQLLRLT